MLQFFSNLADFIGILAFAFSGLLAGKERRLDPVGIFVLAFTTAFGGGILRDVVINNRPFWFITHEYYVWLTLLLTVFAPVLVKRFHHDILTPRASGLAPLVWGSFRHQAPRLPILSESRC